MQIKANQIAVVTGSGSGIGRALALQLSAAGVHLALGDISEAGLVETKKLCEATAPADTRVTTHVVDVSKEAEQLAFRDAVAQAHQTKHINLLFNNAGIGGGGSFVTGSRGEWEQTFGVCWFGVYYGCRAFMPLLVAASAAHVVNVSSVNGFWASLGVTTPHTAYSAAKFAVKGFTEALITDLRVNAPHVQCSVVMPGHIGTSISLNTSKLLGHGEPMQMAASVIAAARARMAKTGSPVADMNDDEIRRIIHQRMVDFKEKAPTTADQAATIILDGVRADRWRILVGEDAQRLDQMVRSDPEQAYEAEFAQATGILSASRKPAK